VDETFRLGTIAGVRVGANWSVLVIFLLLFLGLATGRFPLDYPGLPQAVYVVAGAFAAGVFLLSLLAHELAHAVVARRNGVQVEGITLWMLGGVAKLEGEPPDPGADLRIAGVGPLVSIVLGVCFVGLALLLDTVGVRGITTGVFGWLGLINLVLAVFNLVPAAPLDGGRILRALLWRRRGDRTSAAISAARAGRAFGFLLVMLGIAQLLLIPGLGGVWLMLIGWFVTAAAGAEEQHVRVQRALGGVTVAEVMTPHPVTVPSGMSVAELLDQHLLRERFSSFPIVDASGRLLGLITLRRVRELDPGLRATTSIDRIACPRDEVPRVAADRPVVDLLTLLRGATDGRILVVDEAERVVGIVSPTDITRMLEIIDVRDARDRQHV
jgi:Zn-dependent protease/CBS domain-containing protein